MNTQVENRSGAGEASQSNTTRHKSLAVTYSILSYFAFFITVLYAIGFLGNLVVPKGIDTGEGGISAAAILINVGLLSLFAMQHSVMARPGFKKWFTKVVPAVIERSTYVLLSSLALLFLFWQWQPMTGIIWQINNDFAYWVITAIYFAGWAVVFLSTFMINHFELFGLRQVYAYCKEQPATETPFCTRYFYTFVRHPIMLGFLICMWAAPVMTTGHLLFSAVATAYIVLAVKYLEERDLRRALGDAYVEYQQRVPMLIPRPGKLQRSSQQTAANFVKT